MRKNDLRNGVLFRKSFFSFIFVYFTPKTALCQYIFADFLSKKLYGKVHITEKPMPEGKSGKDVNREMTGQSSKQSDRRIGYIDALKGFAILCVVLGHVADGYIYSGSYPEANKLLYNIDNLIYAFHMPLFMMLSGYLYYTAYFNKSGMPDRKRIYRQIFNQIWVYVIFSVASGLVRAFISSFTDGVLIVEVTPIDVALIWIKPLGIFWYLYVLIILYSFFSIKRLTEINKWVLLGIFITTAICGQISNIPLFEVSRALYQALFFFIGIAGKKYKNWIVGNKYLTIVLFIVAVGTSALVWNKKRDTSKYANQIFLLSIIVALGVSLALWYIFEHISFLKNNVVLQLCGRYSLEIYIIHEYFVSGSRVISLKVGIQNAYISIMLNLIISTAIPILFSILCKRLNIHGLFFKPVTYMTEKMAAYKVGDRT